MDSTAQDIVNTHRSRRRRCALAGVWGLGATVGALAVGVGVGATTPQAGLRPAGSGGLAVSYTAPPPALVLDPYASVEIPVGAGGPSSLPHAAVLSDGGVVLVDDNGRAAYLVGRDGAKSGAITLDAAPKFIVATPGPVVYGLISDPTSGALTMGAVALAGPQTGRVVASAAVGDPQRYLELPIGAFGNVSAGVVDRVRSPGQTMIQHVDVNGAATSVSGLRGLVTIDANNVVADQGSGRQWQLTVERHPDAPAPFAGEAPPAPSASGAVVYWTALGPPSDPADPMSAATLPVVALLEADGGGRWLSVPSGWTLVASDAGGTVFARRTGNTVDLARLDPSLIDPCAEYEPNNRYPLRLCDSGPAVRVAQEGLRRVDAGLPIDNFFGPLTDRAVREFQRQNGLEVDGLIGPLTWRALTAGIAQGRDADGSGVVDPWELGPPDGSTALSPGFPPANTNVTHGGDTWAVVLAASADAEDPAVHEARLAAEGTGYITGPTDCDRGAAAAFGVEGEIVYTVSVYFSSEAEARAAQAAFASRGIPGVATVVTTMCLD